MYTEIKKLTGNNKGFAAAAQALTITECPWLSEPQYTGDEQYTGDWIYLRTRDNDWVAIPGYYSDNMDDAVEFTTVRGKTVVLSADKNADYIGIPVEA